MSCPAKARCWWRGNISEFRRSWGCCRIRPAFPATGPTTPSTLFGCSTAPTRAGLFPSYRSSCCRGTAPIQSPEVSNRKGFSTVTLAYGYVKAKIVSEPVLKPSHRSHETQYHLHFNLLVEGEKWAVAINA